MKVLFLSHSYPREPTDPVGSFVLRLAIALEGEGIRVSVVAPGAPGLPAHELIAGIPVRRFRYAPRSRETLAYTGTMLAQSRESVVARVTLISLLAANTITARAELRRTHADLLHAHWWFPGGLAGTWATRGGQVPLVTTLHGSDIRAARSSPLATRLFRSVLRASSAVTSVSRWLGDEARVIVPEAKPIVAPMPVALGLFSPGAHRLRDRLLFVGKLNEQKGIAHLLRALALMRSRPTLDIVVGVGSEGAESEATRALGEQLGIAAQLRFHPLVPQAQLAELYREATALVAPMVGEGLGLVAIEAAMSGTPVVALDSGGLRDIVVHGRTGFLVQPGDAAALARALDELLARPDQGASLGAAGREHALQTFAPDAVAHRYAELYRRLVRERRS